MKNYRYAKPSQNSLQFTKKTILDNVPAVVHNTMKRFAVEKPDLSPIEKVSVITKVTDDIKKIIKNETGEEFSELSDAFAILSDNNSIKIYANELRGSLNGLVSFLRLLNDDGCFEFSCVYDYPFSSFRGIKLLMPAREDIPCFKDFIDTMVFFRHNILMLEIGGAMEYKRHPEINEGWVEYAEFMSEYSGKAKKIQEQTFTWHKNSIHSNNGGGSYLTQEEVKDILDYCNQRGINVIPEVPSTSHCDYLLIRHPELAERPEDPYPDTFCPSNPDSYKLLFDVLDEVIEVFKPSVINIGHDEYYSINVCDRCRKRLLDNHQIFAEDLTKIHDYLKSKNVKTMIWCDKLMEIHTEDGQNHGGALIRVYEEWKTDKEFYGVIRPTWKARNMIPKDIICMNWFWSYGEEHDWQVSEFPVVFGNFRGMGMTNYRSRCGSNTTGGMCSNWGATSPVYLQRNMVYISLAYNDMLYWDTDYADCNDEEYRACVEGCFKKLFDYNYGAPKNRNDKYIEITHTTDRDVEYSEFVDGIFTDGEEYRNNYYLGYYDVKYIDGTSFKKEVFLGENIGYSEVRWYGKEVYEGASDGTPGIRTVRCDPKLSESAYTTLPVKVGDKVFYRYLMENPYPNKKIADIEFVIADNAEWTVTQI